MRPVLRYARRPAMFIRGLAGALVLAGIVYSLLSGRGLRSSIVYALFIGGGVVIVAAVGLDGGAGAQRRSGYAGGRAAPQSMPFGTVALGAVIIALGVAVLKL